MLVRVLLNKITTKSSLLEQLPPTHLSSALDAFLIRV